VGTRQRTLHLCRVLASLVVWVGDHDHLASKVWEVIELPSGLPEPLGINGMKTRAIGVSAWGRVGCGEHGGRKGEERGMEGRLLTCCVKSANIYNLAVLQDEIKELADWGARSFARSHCGASDPAASSEPSGFRADTAGAERFEWGEMSIIGIQYRLRVSSEREELLFPGD